MVLLMDDETMPGAELSCSAPLRQGYLSDQLCDSAVGCHYWHVHKHFAML